MTRTKLDADQQDQTTHRGAAFRRRDQARARTTRASAAISSSHNDTKAMKKVTLSRRPARPHRQPRRQSPAQRRQCSLRALWWREDRHFTVDEKQLRKVVFTPEAYRIELDLEGNKVMALLHETQFHPVTDASDPRRFRGDERGQGEPREPLAEAHGSGRRGEGGGPHRPELPQAARQGPAQPASRSTSNWM